MASTNNNDENDEPVMTRENDEEPKAPSLFSSLQKICSDSFTRLDRYQLECLGRTGVTALVGVSLAVANIPSAVPSSTAYFIPVFGVFFGSCWPRMLHVVFARLGCIVVSALISCAMSTTVLVAATVSTGLSIAVFSILTLWTTSLWFGETYEMMSTWPGFMLAFMGVLTVTNFAPVQEGYTFDLTKEGSAETMEGFLFDELCQAAGELLMNCTPQTLASSYTNITLPPDANVFAGQTAYLLTEGSPSSSTMVYIPGGLYLVRAFWSPFTNQISVYPSLLVAMAYAAICVAVGILVPPVRTYRSILTKNVIPDALQQVADNLVSEEDFESLKNNSVALMNKIATQKASTTLFEPRCCHFDLLVKELDALLESCRDLIWASVVLPTLDQESANYARKNFCFDQASKQLIEFSKALRYTDLELIHAPTHDPLPTAMTDAAAFVRARCEGIRKPTTEWILAILRPSSKLSSREKVDFVISTGRVWLLAPFLLAQRLGEALLFLFHREHWNGRLLLWGCKWTLGFVALFGLSIYFPVFRDFTLKSSSSPGKPLFLGWQLFGYAFSWQTTVEGTTKKGIQRILGTCLGGLLAWIGVMLCSWSFNGTEKINPYALAFYLVTVIVLAGSIGMDPGINAYNGLGYDHGFIGIYTNIVVLIVALDSYYRVGTVSNLVINRVVATVAGVVMSMIVAAIPPVTRVSNPYIVMRGVVAAKDALSLMLRALIDVDQEYDNAFFKEHALAMVTRTRSRATFNVLDAGRFESLPFYRVSNDLKIIAHRLALNEAALNLLNDLATCLLEKDDKSTVASLLGPAVECILNNDEDETPVTQFVMESCDENAVMLVALAKLTHERLSLYEKQLIEMEKRDMERLPAWIARIEAMDKHTGR